MDALFEIEKEEALLAKQKKNEAAAASRNLRALLILINDWAGRGVNPEFIKIALKLAPLAAGLGMSAGAHNNVEAVLSDLYIGWVNALATYKPEKGPLLAWVQGKFSRLIQNLQSDLCVPGRGTQELDAPVGDGEQSAHDLLANTSDDGKDEEATPDLAVDGIMGLVQKGMSLPQIAIHKGWHVRMVQRDFKKMLEQVLASRIAQMKVDGLSDLQIESELGTRERAPGTGEFAPAPYRTQKGLAPDLMAAAQPKRQPKKNAPAKPKQKRQTVNSDLISRVAPQQAFDFADLYGEIEEAA